MEQLLVAFQVVTDLETSRNVETLFDNGTTHFRARADRHVREEDGFLDERIFLDGHTRRENALDDRTAADDAARRHDGIDGRALVGVVVARKEPCRGLVPVERADRPVVVVQVERRILGTEVHVRFEEGVKRSHVAPVALGRCLFATHDVRVEVIDIDRIVLVQARDDVLAEVCSAGVCTLQKFAH